MIKATIIHGTYYLIDEDNKKALRVPPTIAVGDRVLFTNPSTGQQLIGTVVSHDPEHRLDREWRVDFDSWMFRDVDTRIAHVATEDLARIDYAYKGLAQDSHEA